MHFKHRVAIVISEVVPSQAKAQTSQIIFEVGTLVVTCWPIFQQAPTEHPVRHDTHSGC